MFLTSSYYSETGIKRARPLSQSVQSLAALWSHTFPTFSFLCNANEHVAYVNEERIIIFKHFKLKFLFINFRQIIKRINFVNNNSPILSKKSAKKLQIIH